MQLRVVVVTFLCFWLSLVDCRAIEPEHVRAAMLHEREKILNGSFTAIGEFRSEDPRFELEELDGQFLWKMRFDFVTEDFEFDRKEPKPGVANVTVRTFYARADDSSYFYTDYLQSAAWLRIRKRTGEPVTPGDFQFFDVRGIGLTCSPTSICNSSQLGMKSFFDHYDVKNGSSIDVVQDSPSILRLSFSALNGELVTSLWIDKENGYTPIREIHRQGKETLEETNTVWKHLNGVWVPISLSSISKTPHLKANSEMKIENIVWRSTEVKQSFDWEYVNSLESKISTNYLTLDLPEFTEVFDERGSAPKLVHVFGRKLPNNPDNIPTRSGKFFYGLLALALVCIFGLYLFYKKRARRDS